MLVECLCGAILDEDKLINNDDRCPACGSYLYDDSDDDLSDSRKTMKEDMESR